MKDAFEHIAEESSPQRARDWAAGLLGALSSLKRFPTRCPLAPENEFFPQEIRQLLYGRGRGVYRVLFRVIDGVVSVLHIRHGAQDTLRPEPAEP